MSNCNINKIISDKLSVSKLTKTQEIDITIMSDIDSCLKINTRNLKRLQVLLVLMHHVLLHLI